jgi:putative cardiolipin synthase
VKKIILVALGFMTMATGANADRLTYLPAGEDALIAISRGITRARKTIDLTYFIFDPCHRSTRVLTEQLIEKARAGVRVRVLLDPFMHEALIHQQIAAEMMSAGIEFKSYNDAYRISPGRNHRSHAKLLLTDGNRYITGGRNIGDDYFSLHEGVNFIDRDVLVQGPSAAAAVKAFEMLWNHAGSTKVSVKGVKLRPWKELCSTAAHSADISRASLNELKDMIRRRQSEVMGRLPVRTCERVRFYLDEPEFQDAILGKVGGRVQKSLQIYMNELRLRRKHVTREVLKFAHATLRLLEIENWSYIPSERHLSIFQNLRDRGVGVQVVTNGAAAAGGFLDAGFDHVLTEAARRDTVGTQAVMQISRTANIRDDHELTPRKAEFKLHGKVAVRDRRDALVGSYNIDPRSYHTNLETTVVVEDCPDFASDVLAPITELKETYLRQGGHDQVDPGLFDRILGWSSFNYL